MLPLTVNICTFNRANYLDQVLKSLTLQTLSRDQFEIVLIDDGSSDPTKDVVFKYQRLLPIKYFFQDNAGLAAAKNKGLELATGRIIFFFDDDDVASPTLLEEHLKTHKEYPQDNHAVLNYTTWATNLQVTPLMRFITEVGRYLFSYPGMRNGDILDYTYFWGGRSSCKREFLNNFGKFNPVFRFGCEDIELGYRLSKHGLKVVYNAHAISYMTRPLDLNDFIKRLTKQGNSQFVFSKIYNNTEIDRWCEIKDADENWNNILPYYDMAVSSAYKLENIIKARTALGLEVDTLTERLFFQVLWKVFYAAKIKGISEARQVPSTLSS